MKVFLIWSGDLSHRLALALRDRLPSVIQSIEPFVSSEDIEKGTRWSATIARELEATSVGVVCVTRENLTSSWLNFEAGGLAKSLDESRVMPFLLGLKKSEVQGPLTQFQLTVFDEDDVRKLVASINLACMPPCIEERQLDRAFEHWWPDLQAAVIPLGEAAERLTEATPHQERVDRGAVLEELLDLVRGQNRTMMDLSMLRNALAHSGTRRPSQQAIDDLSARWSAVAMTARGLSAVDSRSYAALFEYIEPGVTRVLKEADVEWNAVRPFSRQDQPEENVVYEGPAYRVLTRPIGSDVIALREFGGGLGDPVAAWVKVDGRVVLRVVAPQLRSAWDVTTEEHFRQAVRRLAAAHDLLGRSGPVTLLFDPPQTSVDDGTSPSGETIERVQHR